MKDPVSTLDGQVYERAAIECWLEQHITSPLTGATLESRALIPQFLLRSLIKEWLEAQA